MLKELRKFGLRYCDLPTMVSNLSCLLRPITLNIDRRNEKSIPIFCYALTLVISTIYCYVYIFSAFWFVFVWSTRSGEIFCAVIVFSLAVASSVGLSKFICMLMYQDTVKDIVEGYLACDALVVPGSRFNVNMLKTLRRVKKRALVFWIVIVGNGSMYIMQTLLTPGRHMMEDCFIFYGLEPMFESPNFETAFAANVISILFSCYLLANITAFFIITAGYTEAHMLASNEELRLLWDEAQTRYKESAELDVETINEVDKVNKIEKKLVNEYIRNRLVDIVKSHTTNINLMRKVEKVFRVAIGMEFLLIISGLIAELLGGLEKTYIQVPYSLMLVGMDCLVGQRVVDAGLIFQNAIYDCQWENFDVPNRKTVLLMLRMAQKDMTLSAGSVATLNYVRFMAVIRFIYTAYTTLRSTM